MSTKTVVLKTTDTVQTDNKVKVVSIKTKKNLDVEDSKIKRSERGSSEPYMIEPNTSIVIKILSEKKPSTVLATLICKDNQGSLANYVCDLSDDGFSVLVENTLSDPREVKIHFNVFYD